MVPANAIWVSLMTAIIVTVAVGQATRAWWQSIRLGALVLALVFLVPAILIAYSHSKSLDVPGLFVSGVLTMNALFWAFILWPRRLRPPAN